MGILRTTLVLGAIIAFMPTPPDLASNTEIAKGESPGPFSYVIAAADTFSDVKGFCMRKPAVCETAASMAVNLEARAKYSAKLIYEWANESTADTSKPAKVPSLDDLKTGSVDVIEIISPTPNRETQSDLPTCAVKYCSVEYLPRNSYLLRYDN